MADAAEPASVAASSGAAAAAPSWRLRTFAAFGVPAFRYYWASTSTYFLIQGTQRFTYVWLVLALSDRSGAAGLAGFALGIPAFVITLPAGVYSDRLDRRRLIATSHVVAMVCTLAVAALVWAGLMSVPLALITAVAVGATTAVSQPAIQAVVPSLVSRERLMNAIVLKNMGMNLAMVIGASLGGVAIALWGIGGAFAVQAVCYGAAAALMLAVRIPPQPRTEQRRAMLREVRDGLAFVAADRRLLVLVLLSMITGLIMLGPVFVLIPQIAKERLGQEAFTASLLFMFTGAGMFTMSFALASLRRFENMGRWFLIALVIGAGVVAGLGLSPSYAITAVLMFAWGLGGGVFINVNQTLVQSHTPPEMMGRVMAIYQLAIAGFMPLGALLAGLAADAVGPSEWLVICGVILFPIALVTLLTQGSLRRMS